MWEKLSVENRELVLRLIEQLTPVEPRIIGAEGEDAE
jgi:hypothetical protein